MSAADAAFFRWMGVVPDEEGGHASKKQALGSSITDKQLVNWFTDDDG
jgi:hypothetical protein